MSVIAAGDYTAQTNCHNYIPAFFLFFRLPVRVRKPFFNSGMRWQNIKRLFYG